MKASAVAAVAVCALLCLATVSAQDDTNPLKCVQFDGDTFQGCMRIKKFDEVRGQLVARGTCTGTLVEDGSSVKRARCYAPVESINDVSPPSAGNRKLLQAPQTCNIVTLKLRSLFLNVLGLQVIIPRPVNVIINAVSGANNLLGTLLCAIANLLTPGSGTLADLTTALNNLVAALNA